MSSPAPPRQTPRRSARGATAQSESQQSAPVSSPLRQMSHSNSQSQSQSQNAHGQAAGLGDLPSSPLRYMSESDADNDDGDRTPRASAHNNAGTSSPIRYDPSSSPGRSNRAQSELRSESSGLFVTGSDAGPRRTRRGDIDSDSIMRTPRQVRRLVLDASGRVVDGGGPPDGSDAPTFGNRDPTTSEADALGGQNASLVWGTTISIDDAIATFTSFLKEFPKKYRMFAEGLSDAEVAAAPDANLPVYREAMDLMLQLGTTKLYLDVQDLRLYPPTRKMHHQILAYPNEILYCMDQCVRNVMLELAIAEDLRNRDSQISGTSTTGSAGSRRNPAGPAASQSSEPAPPPSSDRLGPEDAPTPTPTPGGHTRGAPTMEDQVSQLDYFVRPYNLEKSINLRDLNPSDMDQLLSIKGLVIRTTPVIPDMREGFFRCNECNHSVVVGVDRGRIHEPTECPRPRCGSKNSMQIVHNRCVFEDKQIIKLQETPDAVPAGQTPHSVSVWAYNELVDFCKAGDRVQVTGVFRVCPVRVNPRQRTLKSVHKTYVDAVHVQKVDKRRMGQDPATLVVEGEDNNSSNKDHPDADVDAQNNGDDPTRNHLAETRRVSAEDEQRIRDTAARPDIYELLSRSLAPSIYEMDDVKKGILLQLFGGTNKTFRKGGSPKYRGDINVLLCGDPSTSKSQLLQYVHKIAPRGVYTSGKGSSAVGLTAYVARDPESRQLVLESGALVLSDGGVCCIDEFDKMSDGTRSVLHEVMEQQTVSVAKAGIITTLNARTSILASANPIGSRYNPDLPVPQNIDLPPTLLSRFDLVYLILDRVDEKNDRRLAKHLLSMYLEDTPQSAPTNNEILPVEFLTLYISYARATVQPTISDEAAKELVEAYVEMRKLGQDVRAAEKRITATTRQLESMIRLAEAHAKMRLSPVVTRDDVREANRLIQSALKTAATDAQGRIDMSLLTEGTSAAERRRKADLKDAIVRVLDDMTAGGQAVRWSDVARRLAEAVGGQGAVGAGGVDQAEFAEAMRALEAEAKIMISGDGARRMVRRVTAVV